MGILPGGGRGAGAPCLVEERGQSEAVLELGSRVPHFLWALFIYGVLAMEGARAGTAKRVPSGKAGREGEAGMEPELGGNLSGAPGVERSQSCWDRRRIWGREDIFQTPLGQSRW